MMAVKRGREELRFRFVRGRSGGKDVAWHDLRLFWQGDDGAWRPGTKGISIRSAELRPLLDALTKATSGTRADTPAPSTPPPANANGAPVAPFGRSKGKLLADLDDDDLKWLRGALERSVGDPSKATYREKNQRDLDAVVAELRGRFLE